MATWFVNTELLNLRRAPQVNAATLITTLPRGHHVSLSVDVPQGWVDVTTKVGTQELTGYVDSQFLARLPDVLPVGAPTAWQTASNGIPAAWLRPIAAANLKSASRWQFPVDDASLPHRDAATGPDRAAQLTAIVAALQVTSSDRYAPANGDTYCNVYAADVCWLARAYLPRVWWTPKALVRLAKGEAVIPDYGATVGELNANALHDWLTEWGDEFGWTGQPSAAALQAPVDAGGVAVITARNKEASRSGHISVVIPATASHAALRVDKGSIPVQSQAGRTNRAAFVDAWWERLAAQFDAVGFWTHA